jgi:AmmeMemoRadiSam system protein A
MSSGGDDGRALLELARASVRHGLNHGKALESAGTVGGILALPGACFVSLHLGEELRGCVGRTEASPRLADQLLDNAWAAAFRDPRFAPLTPEEFDRLSFEVHVLTPMRPLPFTTLADLHAKLRPGIDGLQLETPVRRGLFLPVMWEQLPQPEEFVRQLLRKAQIAPSERFSASRFEATVFMDP